MSDVDPALVRIADDLGVHADALDAFVFRRVDTGQMVHLGGIGRAVGWAGVIDVTVDDEPLLRDAWTTGRPTRQTAVEVSRVFGPYWAASAIATPLPRDHLVVFGCPEPVDADDEVITGLARRLVERIGEVSPAKRLADELEVLHAVRRVAQSAEADVQTTADRIVRTAVDALSCELGIVWVPQAEVLAIADTTPGSPLPQASGDVIVAMMMRLFAERDTLPHCQQDNTRRPLPSPLDADSPVVAWYAATLPGPPDGLLLLCHTTAKPRGFTQLCQQVGLHIAEAAATPLATALAQERLRAQLAQVSVEARQDALTGLANRRVWLETVAELAGDRRRRDTSVVMLDVDRLKHVNDQYGHRAGDDMLRAVAGALVASIRDGDVAARLGGDEFALMLPDTDEQACRQIVNRISDAVDRLAPVGDCPPAASIGWAHVTADGCIDDALRHADQQMYETKRARQPGDRHGATLD